MMRISLLLLLSAVLPLSANPVTLTAKARLVTTPTPSRSVEKITLAEGDLATVKYLSHNAYLDVTIGTTLIRLAASIPEQAHLPVVAGPATLQLLHFDNLNAAMVTIEVQRAGTPKASTPHNVVVIPGDNSGDYDVFLESSSDMVTWTATQAGAFNASKAKRFFRVRLAKRAP